jgi:SAM-dependent methyltransferase
MSKPENANSKIVVSGASVGGEIQALLDAGFNNIAGTEIDDIYVDICRHRFGSKIEVKRVKDETMPFETNSLAAVFSAHIIEHTLQPKKYISESLRCLTDGGLLFLEFPSRYNSIELHTGTRSVEWMPIFLRNIVLFLLSVFAPAASQRSLYRSVLTTLRPIGVSMVMRFARSSGYKAILEGRQRIHGIERIVIRVFSKTQGNVWNIPDSSTKV